MELHTMMDYAAFLKTLKANYVPSMYEVHGDKKVDAAHRAYPWTGSMLYYELFRNVYPYLHAGANVMDLGAYPGSFLRMLKSLFQGDLNLFGYGMVFESDEVRKYNEKRVENPKTKCLATEKPFLEFMKDEGASFTSGNLDYCDVNAKTGAAFSNIANLAGTMDFVTCMEVIEHLHTPYYLMDLSQRLLKKGGTLILETNNVRWMVALAQLLGNGSNLDIELVDKYKLNDPTIKHPHVRYYSLRELSLLCEKAGLKIKAAYDFNWYYPPHLLSGKEKLKAIAKSVISQVPGFRSHILVAAEKP